MVLLGQAASGNHGAPASSWQGVYAVFWRVPAPPQRSTDFSGKQPCELRNLPCQALCQFGEAAALGRTQRSEAAADWVRRVLRNQRAGTG